MSLTAIGLLKTIMIYDNSVSESEAFVTLEGYKKSFFIPNSVLSNLTINNFAGKVCQITYNNLLQLQVEEIVAL